jgi:hypothetical protein
MISPFEEIIGLKPAAGETLNFYGRQTCSIWATVEIIRQFEKAYPLPWSLAHRPAAGLPVVIATPVLAGLSHMANLNRALTRS